MISKAKYNLLQKGQRTVELLEYLYFTSGAKLFSIYHVDTSELQM